MRPNPSPNIRESWSAANQIKEIWPSLFSREKKRVGDFLTAELNLRPILAGDDRRVYLCDILLYDQHRNPYKEFGVGWGFANQNPKVLGQTMEWWCELTGIKPIYVGDRNTSPTPSPKKIIDRRTRTHNDIEKCLRHFVSKLPFKLRLEFKEATYANGRLYAKDRFISKGLDGYRLRNYKAPLFRGQAIAQALEATPFIKVTV